MPYSNAAKIKDGVKVFLCGSACFAGACILTENEKFYKAFTFPLLTKLDGETAHRLVVRALGLNLFSLLPVKHYENLHINVLSRSFNNPIGMAAGLDKNAEAITGAYDLGFGFVEVGTVTPLPQPGNPKPRVFRLIDDEAVINRYGFNSDGADLVAKRVWDYKALTDAKRDARQAKSKHVRTYPDTRNMLNVNWMVLDSPKLLGKMGPYVNEPCILGVNIGRNKETTDEIEDFVKGVKVFGLTADYLVVNVSSPNTPGLRKLQQKESLKQLISTVSDARDRLLMRKKPAILVKLSPDLSVEELSEISSVLLVNGKPLIDGVILTNTTLSRPASLKSANKFETGGLSGKPIKKMSTECIKTFYRLTGGKIPIIGVGGVSSGQDAFEKICAGASLVQVYTGLLYHGPGLPKRICAELSNLVEEAGFNSVADAVGSDCR